MRTGRGVLIATAVVALIMVAVLVHTYEKRHKQEAPWVRIECSYHQIMEVSTSREPYIDPDTGNSINWYRVECKDKG